MYQNEYKNKYEHMIKMNTCYIIKDEIKMSIRGGVICQPYKIIPT